ncbi:hypothetical protein J1C67_19315 (plasmid) [Clostridium gasigenes]|uniref:hypothetical protein n=1 Tax=Clostridium gasigenes TaxID=94869 RepID=UPI0014384106|nr:hypothetical protein [Clostridium gasigenes]NKF08821.1 hypothetical protein [Clostridium gasigenes]QSW21541.1 hypothetical protein J1C67_19315 [Clostridium gasigenes]
MKGVIMDKLNQDKANKLHDLITEILNTCGGECDKCVLEDVCDDLDILSFQLFSKI